MKLKFSRASNCSFLAPYIPIHIYEQPFIARIDTGADICIVPEEVLWDEYSERKVRDYEGNIIRRKTYLVPIRFESEVFEVEASKGHSPLLGMNFLKNFKFTMEGDEIELETLQ